MKILNKMLEKDLENKSINLELGCGERKREGFYGIDHIELEGVDIVADLNEPLTLLPDNCCNSIYSGHVLEHINELLPLMREIHRISKPDSIIEINVPHFSNVYGYSDPTHVRFFGLYTMYHFASKENQPKIRKVPSFYTDTRFIVKSVTIQFYRSNIFERIFIPIFSKLVNLNIYTQNFYERRLSSIFHAWQIKYILIPEKNI
jgi:ubiquinone/menaquinone biosynthesis C-methylase UbiE